MLPSGRVAGYVAGLVQQRSGLRRERIVHKFCRRHLTAVQISAGYAFAANMQLAANAHRLQLHVRIQNANLRVRDGPPNRSGEGIRRAARRPSRSRCIRWGHRC